MFKTILKRVLPAKLLPHVRQIYQNRIRARIQALPALTEIMFTNILRHELELKDGDVVFIHSAVDRLHLAFPFYRILSLIRKIIGEHGTMLFVTYPKLSSYEYLLSGEIFDVKNTPSYTGILSEFARRQKEAIRSLHPTKSVCAIGRYALDLTNTHQHSPFPYDACSPYYKIMQYDGKIIGLGVSTSNLSFVHCVDDALKDAFPAKPYHQRLFQAKCITYDGSLEIVRTFAHNQKVMHHDIPLYMRRHISKEVCKDITIQGMKFFRAKAGDLFTVMLDLAKENITIYPQRSCKRR
jgi:aminoglycoside 3-N-acetyltransferase